MTLTQDDCCNSASGTGSEAGGRSTGRGRCPESGNPGRAVSWTTVAALTWDALPDPQQFWICLDRFCPVVYFGSRGARIEADAVKLVPGCKEGSDGLICYCFRRRRADIEAELRDTGTTLAVEQIRQKIQEGACACEVRNPEGRCCLGALRRAVAELKRTG